MIASIGGYWRYEIVVRNLLVKKHTPVFQTRTKLCGVMNAEKRTRRQRHNNFCVGGIPPLLRESNASAVMGFILLCQWCVCQMMLVAHRTSPFHYFPISDFRPLGHGAFESTASAPALLLRRVS